MSGFADRDERIAAFIDGSMEGAELAAFEAELASDASLAAEVEQLMSNDTLLREAFDAPMQEPVDDALLARMGLLPRAGEEVVHIAGRHRAAAVANDNPPFRSRWAMPIGGAIAAALALAVVFNAPGGGGNEFDRALDETPSGQFVALDNETELSPLLSFAASDGRYCREFSLAREGSSGGSGIACRGNGAWQVEALEKGAVELADPGEIALASGQDGSALDAAYERLGASDPFDAEREAQLIERDWSASEK